MNHSCFYSCHLPLDLLTSGGQDPLFSRVISRSRVLAVAASERKRSGSFQVQSLDQSQVRVRVNARVLLRGRKKNQSKPNQTTLSPAIAGAKRQVFIRRTFSLFLFSFAEMTGVVFIVLSVCASNLAHFAQEYWKRGDQSSHPLWSRS